VEPNDGTWIAKAAGRGFFFALPHGVRGEYAVPLNDAG